MSYDEITFWQKSPTKACPVVWTHRSGRKSLLLGATADYVIGMPVEESRALLARLRDWATQPQYVYRHEWQAGDLLIWDNTGTMHRALPYAADSGRLMHRTILAGKSRCSETRYRDAGGHQRRGRGAGVGARCHDRGHRPGRRGRGSARLSPYDVQRAHRLPASEAGRRGARYWDPLATLGYMAARTHRIRFATMTLVLGYHHPLAIVKRYGTLDHVSGGRVILGVGVGSLKEEFDLLGAPFDDRGARADDALRALRVALPTNEPAYDGEFYSFGGLTVDPCALQPQMPIWVGGRTKRSLRRAVTLADGWCPYDVSAAHAAEWLSVRDVPDGFEVVLPAETPLDPVGSRMRPRRRSRRWPRPARRRCSPISVTAHSSTIWNRSMRWLNCTDWTERRHDVSTPDGR